MSGVLDGKCVLVTGVITTSSIAFHTAREAQLAGAQVILTGLRPRLVNRIATRLPRPAPVIELDVTDDEHLRLLKDRVAEHTDRLDGVLHSIAYAPQSALGGRFMDTPWEDVATAVHTSAYSLKSLVGSVLPLMGEGGAVVGLDFDASVSWPDYDWMGVAKAGLESTARYLARYLGPQGIRVNLVAAGPLNTLAAGRVSDAEDDGATWADNAPLGWDEGNATPTARACVALLSDWFTATTGEIVHVDGGVHAMGF
ncbi:enoyl-ACP reductase FabI [Streptomyces prasinopilosus]|uniref:enoyl-ACP reductase FabI n=1 Tax=Streptomyces prasinopilosus TaxID=67344 RepID=UPI0006EB48D4|nr:enoyl-ACP reductase FabI [Streptomyces prasinopilosus]